MVIDAVRRVEERIRGWEAGQRGRRFAELVMLVTGDGRRRKEFERRFAGLPARRVQLRTRWLEPEDYPRIVGAADLGLCLHRSSSGMDIPMKVADLFGAGVPVCALDYGASLAEQQLQLQDVSWGIGAATDEQRQSRAPQEVRQKSDGECRRRGGHDEQTDTLANLRRVVKLGSHSGVRNDGTRRHARGECEPVPSLCAARWRGRLDLTAAP